MDGAGPGKFGDTVNAFVTERFGADRACSRSSYSRFLSGQSVPTAASNVEEFLKTEDFWPLITSTDILIPSMVDFFGGSALHHEMITQYPGHYRYYQRSTAYGGKNVSVYKMRIHGPNPEEEHPTYLHVTNQGRGKPGHIGKELFAGVLFENGDKPIMTLRETERRGPCFMLIVGFDRQLTGEVIPKTPTTDEVELQHMRIIFGRLLKTSRHDKRRHQCNWFCERIQPDEDVRMGVWDADSLFEKGNISDEALHYLFEVPDLIPED